MRAKKDGQNGRKRRVVWIDERRMTEGPLYGGRRHDRSRGWGGMLLEDVVFAGAIGDAKKNMVLVDLMKHLRKATVLSITVVSLETIDKDE
jgi:hypothetical protein